MPEPRYVQIKRALVESIDRGDHRPGEPFITERALCERFGVSRTTAVRTLNELVAESVLVRRQGSGTFVAERRAAATGGWPAPTISVILQRHGPYISDLLAGLSEYCDEFGYQILISQCYDSPERESMALRRAMEAGVHGIILYSCESSVSQRELGEIRARGVPLVLVDRYRPDVPTDAVVADNLAIGYDVTTELIRRGHERIATLWGETDCTSVRDRFTGHQQALRDAGIPLRPELSALRRYVEPSTLRHHRGILEGLLTTEEPPTMLLCSNGFVLARVAEDLATLGVQVPSDIDLAGMDDTGPFDILPLTVVAARLPAAEIGQRTAALLHERITGGCPAKEAQHLVLPIEVVTREAAPGHLRLVAG